MQEEKIQSELQDIREMIQRYCTTNKNNVSFVWSFVGFKKDEEHKCIDCGNDCDIVDDKKSMVGCYGDLATLRILSNEIRDLIEDNIDEDGFVNV